MAAQPLLRRVFDRAERAIGAPLEDVVRSSHFMDAYLLQRRVGRGLRAALDRPTGAFLHLINIPARNDVRRVNRQIAALTEEVRALSARLDAQQLDHGPVPTRSPRRRASTRTRTAA
jgi:hypothetical protein